MGLCQFCGGELQPLVHTTRPVPPDPCSLSGDVDMSVDLTIFCTGCDRQWAISDRATATVIHSDGRTSVSTSVPAA